MLDELVINGIEYIKKDSIKTEDKGFFKHVEGFGNLWIVIRSGDVHIEKYRHQDGVYNNRCGGERCKCCQ